MNPEQIVRAWKEKDYREALPAELRESIPSHPAGNINTVALTAEDLEAIRGGVPSGFRTLFRSRVGTKPACSTTAPTHYEPDPGANALTRLGHFLGLL
ncbi:MAG: mersacidin/lichenicidin family type 2 lantibiotic [Candidatus Eisenbacteria bacterium]